MDINELISKLPPELKEKAKNCKSIDDVKKLAKDSGITIPDGLLDGNIDSLLDGGIDGLLSKVGLKK